jgi:hypothetical protein
MGSRSSVLTGVAATVLAMISVQSGAAIAISLFAAVGPLAVVALRLASASGFLMATARPGTAPLRTAAAGPLIGFGLVIAGMNGCFYLAIERVPLGVAVARGSGAGGISQLLRWPYRASWCWPLPTGSTGPSRRPGSCSPWEPAPAGPGTSRCRHTMRAGFRAPRGSRWRW